MVEHLEVRIHIACISLVDETIVVRGTLNLLSKIEDNEDVGVHIDSFDFCYFVELTPYYFHSLFNDFRGHLIRGNPTRFPPNNIHFVFLVGFVHNRFFTNFRFNRNCLGVLENGFNLN